MTTRREDERRESRRRAAGVEVAGYYTPRDWRQVRLGPCKLWNTYIPPSGDFDEAVCMYILPEADGVAARFSSGSVAQHVHDRSQLRFSLTAEERRFLLTLLRQPGALVLSAVERVLRGQSARIEVREAGHSQPIPEAGQQVAHDLQAFGLVDWSSFSQGQDQVPIRLTEAGIRQAELLKP